MDVLVRCVFLTFFVAACVSTPPTEVVLPQAPASAERPVQPLSNPLPLSRAALEIAARPLATTERDHYLGLSLPFEPFSLLRQEISRRIGIELEHRGEAHLTVITPPEFEVLSTKLTMKHIIDLGGGSLLQKISLELLCVGHGERMDGSRKMQTYYVVARSNELIAFRRKVAEAFIQRGGRADVFVADAFYPHLTVGFIVRDLHLADGLIKDSTTCEGVGPISWL